MPGSVLLLSNLACCCCCIFCCSAATGAYIWSWMTCPGEAGLGPRGEAPSEASSRALICDLSAQQSGRSVTCGEEPATLWTRLSVPGLGWGRSFLVWRALTLSATLMLLLLITLVPSSPSSSSEWSR